MTRRTPGPVPDPTPWPPYLPHVHIDALMRRLEAGELDASELEGLCELIGAELIRVRSTTAQLASLRLEQARAQAQAILATAREEAGGFDPCVVPTSVTCPGRAAKPS